MAWGAGLGSTVLLVMLGLWWAALDESASLALRHSTRRAADVKLGHDICDKSLYPPPWELRTDQLTILVNGFIEARLPLLQSSLQTYSSSPAVHSVFILWGNTSTPDSLLQAAKFESMGAPIYIVRQQSTSLNDRFLPRRHVKTKAVMICDDDITVDSKSLDFALQVCSLVFLFPSSLLRSFIMLSLRDELLDAGVARESAADCRILPTSSLLSAGISLLDLHEKPTQILHHVDEDHDPRH
jgi:hypothetical protein